LNGELSLLMRYPFVVAERFALGNNRREFHSPLARRKAPHN
jgi:hypothetical protein